MSVKRVIKLVCTDRGRHQPWAQYEATVSGLFDAYRTDRDRFANEALQLPLAAPGENLVDELEPVEINHVRAARQYLELRCPKCPRTPRVAAHRVRLLGAYAFDQFAAGRVTVEVDLSLLP
jgi:hypothetical protein